ncbi:MAG TPA: hypothetical protein VG897_03110, partial [Terriglobales bacterium]|nr:hypothetical protein [Terriglobales bacterium]
MKALITAVLSVLLAIPVFAKPQTASDPSASPQQDTTHAPITAASDSVRILSPTLGQNLGQSAVTLRYELTNQAATANASPNYRIQLDGRDPIETLDTEYSFTGLAPGNHTIIVELVDANHVPI